MISLEQAKNLKFGDRIFITDRTNKKGDKQCWKVNGQVQTWKRSPDRVKVPIKHGLYSFDYLTEKEIDLVEIEQV